MIPTPDAAPNLFDRALLLMPDGDTAIVPSGGDFELDDNSAKLVSVSAHSVDYTVGGKKKTLQLEAAQTLVSQAAKQSAADAASSTASPQQG